MKYFLREWFRDVVFLANNHKIAIGCFLLILIASFFTGEFESFKDFYIPNLQLTFLWLTPLFVITTIVKTANKFVMKYYGLLEELNKREAKDRLASQLEEMVEKNRKESGVYNIGHLLHDGTKLMGESGLVSRALIRKFNRSGEKMFHISYQEEILNEILTELKWQI